MSASHFTKVSQSCDYNLLLSILQPGMLAICQTVFMLCVAAFHLLHFFTCLTNQQAVHRLYVCAPFGLAAP